MITPPVKVDTRTAPPKAPTGARTYTYSVARGLNGP